MRTLTEKLRRILHWSERYTHTDMVYLAKSTFWLNANSVVSSIFSFILSIAFAHLLPKESYGTYQFLLSLFSFVGAFTLSGMNVAIIRAVSRGFEGSFLKSIRPQFQWSLAAFVVASGIATYYFLHENITLSVGMLVVAVLTPFLTTFNTYSAFVTGKKDFRRMFWNYQVINVLLTLAMLVALLYTNNPALIALTNLGINTVVAIFLFFLTIRHYHPNSQEDPETLTLGKHLSLSGLIANTIAQLDKILIFHYVGVIELAIYTFATAIPERLFNTIRSITVSALPKFSLRTPEEVRHGLLSKSLRFFLLSLAAAIVYALLAPLLFKIFFSTYLESIPYSQVYFFMIALGSLHMLPLTALNGLGLHRELYVFNTATAIFKILIMLILVLLYGAWGLVFSKGVSGLFNFGLSSWLIKKAAIRSESNPSVST